VPFFFKQWNGPTPKSGGRLLDGQTRAQFPGSPPHAPSRP
jgi:protein gp37